MTRFSSLSIRTQLTLHWTAAFAILLAMANVAIYFGTRSLTLRDFDAQVRTVAATELSSSTDEWLDVHLHQLPAGTPADVRHMPKVAQIVEADGRVRFSSESLDHPLVPPDALATALAGGAPLFDAVLDGQPLRVVAVSAVHRGDRFVLAVGVSLASLHAMLRRLAWLLAGVWAAGLVLTAGLGFALASRAMAPIDHITRRASEIARGDFARRLDPPRTNDEIGRMTLLLNQMLERLHGAVEANRRFAADASHELRSPLTAIAGEVDVALKRDRPAAAYRETLEVVRASLSQMTDLTENLLVLGRTQDGSTPPIVEEVALAPVLAGAVERVAHRARERQVTMRCAGLEGGLVYGDARLYARVFDNLLANAVAYNREGGIVEVSAGWDEAASGAWAVDRVTIAVRDEGGGIPREEWERVFERFRRLDSSRTRATGGAGLGLAIARDIVTLYGGQVRVGASGVDGTTFEVVLPGRHEVGARLHAARV